MDAGVEAGYEFGLGSVKSVDTYVSSEWVYDSVVPLLMVSCPGSGLRYLFGGGIGTRYGDEMFPVLSSTCMLSSGSDDSSSSFTLSYVRLVWVISVSSSSETVRLMKLLPSGFDGILAILLATSDMRSRFVWGSMMQTTAS